MDTLDKLLEKKADLEDSLIVVKKKIKNLLNIDKEAFLYVMTNYLSDIAREIVKEITPDRYLVRGVCFSEEGACYITLVSNGGIVRINPSFSQKLSVSIVANCLDKTKKESICLIATDCIKRRINDRKRGDL